ncbi:MAG: carbohydrate kinase family protein [Methanomassiliicoccales archaeon]|nr:MAG: carbohydrate kinase family protein [Methanomassiliicoccales archaeon]
MQFIGCGALNLDRLYKVQDVIKGDEEIPIVDTVEEPGGSAANTIYALGKLNMSAGFIGAVGSDGEGEKVLRSLSQVGIDTSHIKIKAKVKTGLVIGFVDPKGERALYISPGANNLFSHQDMDMEYLKRADFIHMSSFVDDTQLALQKKIADVLEDRTLLSFAPGSLYAKRGFESLSPLVKRSHVLFLNEEEVRLLTGKETYESAAKFLIDSGCETVVITLGAKGCFITDGTESAHVDANKTPVIDTTGAGDAFCAGFLYGLSEKRELEKCGMIGNYLASKCISELGARKGLPTREMLEDELAEIF